MPRSWPYKWQALVAVCFGTYMATMDFSLVNVALPQFAEEFNRGPDAVVWIALGTGLVVTGLTLTAGRTGDLFGRKRVYLVGWSIFTLGITGASFANSLEMVIALRLVQAVGLSMVIANGNAIVTDAFGDNERGRALGIVGSVVGAGLMSGPIFGGLIIDLFDWRALFYLRIPVGFGAMLLVGMYVRESGPQAGERRLDLPGSATLFLALAATLLAVNRGESWGWTSPAVLGTLAVGLTSGVLFVAIESRVASPVLSLALFRARSFAISIVSLILNFAGQSSVIFLMPFYLLSVRGYSPTETGLTLAVVPLMMLLLSSVTGTISDRTGWRHLATVGIAVITLGLFSLASLGEDTPLPLVMVRLGLIGVGAAIFGPPNASEIMGGVPRQMLGTASAAVATSRNIGNSIGLAFASAVVVAVAARSVGLPEGVPSSEDLPPDALLSGIRSAFLVAGGISSGAVVVSLFRPSRVVVPRTLAREADAAGGGDGDGKG